MKNSSLRLLDLTSYGSNKIGNLFPAILLPCRRRHQKYFDSQAHATKLKVFNWSSSSIKCAYILALTVSKRKSNELFLPSFSLILLTICQLQWSAAAI
ncbi:hypothetical protein TSAR_002612 [Trichomalopsis sarcophagae]|uniref:Uncharacterized protein n=1 Tax=Trichomalopsis sarcophagae TaxID=543379 RepID=A0A232FJH8_9HYME|nr:hypothetical protein TSAR_002612 [Trichomalopsis sarcophagae]